MLDRDLVKAVVGLAASAGVGVIVRNVVKHTTPIEVKRGDKILIGIGSFAISGMLSNHTIKYTDDQTDFIFNTIEKIKMNRNGSGETYVIPEDSPDVK